MDHASATGDQPDGAMASGKGITPIQRAFYDSLCRGGGAGWLCLQQTGFLAAFVECCEEDNLHAFEFNAQGFFDYCTHGLPNGFDVVMNAKSALYIIKAPEGLSEVVCQLLRHLISVGIERWVNDAATSVTQRAPELGSSISLALSEPWVVYLIAVAKLKLKCSLPASPASKPPGLITVNAPLEGITEDSITKSVGEAVMKAFHGQNFALPMPGRDFLRHTVKDLGTRWRSAPMTGVQPDQGNQWMRTPVAQQLALDIFNLHTVEYGADSTCEETLQKFENSLRVVLQEINQLLYPTPPKEEHMNPAPPNPPANAGETGAAGGNSNGPVFHINAPGAIFGNVNKLGQANAPGAQAMVADQIQQGVASADLPALLAAFLSAARSTPALAEKLPYVEEWVGELQTQVQQPQLDAPASKGIKRYFDYLEMALKGIDNGGLLLQKLGDIKDAAIARFPDLQSLLSNLPGGGS